MKTSLKWLLFVVAVVAVGGAAALVIYLSVIPKTDDMKISKDTPAAEDFMYKKAEEPDDTTSMTASNGTFYEETGARYVPESEAEYREWYAAAGDNHIDNPYREEILCANWLCRQLSRSTEDITWLSWLQPAEDEEYCHTIRVGFSEEEYLVRWNSETDVFVLVEE